MEGSSDSSTQMKQMDQGETEVVNDNSINNIEYISDVRQSRDRMPRRRS